MGFRTLLLHRAVYQLRFHGGYRQAAELSSDTRLLSHASATGRFHGSIPLRAPENRPFGDLSVAGQGPTRSPYSYSLVTLAGFRRLRNGFHAIQTARSEGMSPRNRPVAHVRALAGPR
jgi:hypothetical protein